MKVLYLCDNEIYYYHIIIINTCFVNQTLF